MKILIVGPAWLGDMVMAQTLFRLLKELYPTSSIDVLAPRATAAMASRMSEIAAVHLLPFGHGDLRFWQRIALGKSLRKEHYDWAIVLTNTLKSALVPFFARIPRRTGWLGEQRYGLLNDWRRLNKKHYPLMIERFMALALHKGAALPTDLSAYWPKLSLSEDELNQTLLRLQLKKPEHPVIALCPGAAFGPAKRWPVEYFAAVAQQKLAEGWDVWLLGGPDEVPLTQAIADATSGAAVDFAGKTKLTEVVDLLSLASVVLTNDSGLMHVAAAVRKPVVVVYGSSSPDFTPPLSRQSRIMRQQLSCQPCFKRECPLGHLDCLKKLYSHQVVQVIEEVCA